MIRWAERLGCPLTLRRAVGVAKVSTGMSCNQAARELLCAPSTVVCAVRRFLEDGRKGLLDRRAGNGTRKADRAFLRELRGVLMGRPQTCGWRRTTWTRELLAKELARRGKSRVSVTTMGRALTQVGASLKSPKPIVRCPWPAAQREARLAQLKNLAAQAPPDEAVFYADEMDVHLNPKVGKEWTLPGRRRVVLTPGNNQKRYVAGALNAKSGRISWVTGASKASALFVSLAQRLAWAYPKARRISLILDNASIHSSKKTKAALEELGGRVRLHFLPPYCPQGNRIERTWLDVHANVTRNHRCRNMDALVGEVDAYLAGRNQQLTSSPALRLSAKEAA